MTEIHTLQPGTKQARPDWSPTAQPEDQHGVIAHTPDPGGYHDVGGRTMLPRSLGDHGASRGFTTRPGVLNIDPSDPVTGKGGITVDLEQISKQGYKAAAEASHGNPVAAWQLAAKMQKAPDASQPPSQPVQATMQPSQTAQPYVVPHTTPSGGVATWRNDSVGISDPTQPSPIMDTGSVFPQAAQIQAMASPATKPRKESSMPQPEEVESWAQPQPQPQPQSQSSPVLQAAPGQMPPQAPPQQVLQQPPAVPADPTQMTLMLQLLIRIADRLTEKDAVVGDGKEDSDPRRSSRREPAEPGSWQSRLAEPDRVSEPGPERTLPLETDMAGAGLAFLTDPPGKPTIQVVFDLGAGGMHSKRFHHIARRGVCLSLVYDSRYDGDQFIPAPTLDGETIGVRISSQNIDVRAMVFDYHQNIGCLDILNFIIWQPSEQLQGPPIMTPDTEQEIHSLVNPRQNVL